MHFYEGSNPSPAAIKKNLEASAVSRFFFCLCGFQAFLKVLVRKFLVRNEDKKLVPKHKNGNQNDN